MASRTAEVTVRVRLDQVTAWCVAAVNLAREAIDQVEPPNQRIPLMERLEALAGQLFAMAQAEHRGQGTGNREQQRKPNAVRTPPPRRQHPDPDRKPGGVRGDDHDLVHA